MVDQQPVHPAALSGLSISPEALAGQPVLLLAAPTGEPVLPVSPAGQHTFSAGLVGQHTSSVALVRQPTSSSGLAQQLVLPAALNRQPVNAAAQDLSPICSKTTRWKQERYQKQKIWNPPTFTELHKYQDRLMPTVCVLWDPMPEVERLEESSETDGILLPSKWRK